MAITAVVTIALLIIFYKEMVIISFDETYAKLIGIKVGRFQFISTIILALVVSLSLATVGVLLVASLMIIPVAAAMKVGKSFKNTIGISILFSELSVIGGLWLSYELDVASGATIVLINILILVLVVGFKNVFVSKRLKKTQTDLMTK